MKINPDVAKQLSTRQVSYLHAAERLVKAGARCVDDIESNLGYGVIDKSMLKDTFFDQPIKPKRRKKK